MNNLTTQKIVLGLLMTLVLAFSVPGTADAITKFTKTSPTDNQVVAINQPFTIRFSVNLQGNKRIPNSAGTGYVDQDGLAIDADGYFLADNGFYKNAAEDVIDSEGYFRNSAGNRYNANGDAIDSSGYLLDGSGERADPATKATTGDNPTTQVRAVDRTRTKTTSLKQFHFNEESISIAATSEPTGGSITFTKGSTDVTGLSEHAKTSDERFPTSSSSISLSC